MRPGADYIEMTGPKGKLQSVHWPDRPDVFGPIGADGLPVCVNWTRWPAVNPVVNQGRCELVMCVGFTVLQLLWRDLMLSVLIIW